MTAATDETPKSLLYEKTEEKNTDPYNQKHSPILRKTLGWLCSKEQGEVIESIGKRTPIFLPKTSSPLFWTARDLELTLKNQALRTLYFSNKFLYRRIQATLKTARDSFKLGGT